MRNFSIEVSSFCEIIYPLRYESRNSFASRAVVQSKNLLYAVVRPFCINLYWHRYDLRSQPLLCRIASQMHDGIGQENYFP